MVWEGGKSAISLGLGAFLIVIGLWPVLAAYAGLMAVPQLLLDWIPPLMPWLFLLGGTFLLYDAFGEWGGWYCWVSVLLGLTVIGLGSTLVLYGFNVIPFTIPMPQIAYSVLFVLEGIFLIIGSFTQL